MKQAGPCQQLRSLTGSACRADTGSSARPDRVKTETETANTSTTAVRVKTADRVRYPVERHLPYGEIAPGCRFTVTSGVLILPVYMEQF
ncbi:MAG: hypothetical protein LBL04_02145 [Bacteroidales bacterium]|nr:hypothetical protein [Bacteroidales bacterium]